MRGILGSIAICCLCLSGKLSAQADSILALPSPQRLFALYDWHHALLAKDSAIAIQHLVTANAVFVKQKAVDLQKMAHIELALDQVQHRRADIRNAILDDAIDFARKNKWADVSAELEYVKASFQFWEDNSTGAIETMVEKIDFLEKNGFSNPYIRMAHYSGLGYTFFTYADYTLAIRYMRKAVDSEIPHESAGFEFGAFNNLGLVYTKTQQYDSAIYCFQQALDIVQLRKLEAWEGVLMGNIGNAYYKKGDHASALPYLEADFQLSIAHNIIGSAVNVSMMLANVELARGNINKSREYIQFNRDNIDTNILGCNIIYAENMYAYSKRIQDYRAAVAYADTLQRYTARQEKIFNKELLDKVRMREQAARYSKDVELLKAAKKRQILLRNGLFIIFMLTGIVALLLVKRIEYIRRVHKEKMAKAEADLNWFTKSLIEKNELIQSFRDKQEQSGQVASDPSHEKSVSISELTHATILTEDDWKRFRLLFDEVYPGFLVRLKDKFNDLTPSELRLLALTKLRIEPKDMADMLGISPDSIKKTRYRLRKKINLPEEGTLDELVRLV